MKGYHIRQKLQVYRLGYVRLAAGGRSIGEDHSVVGGNLRLGHKGITDRQYNRCQKQDRKENQDYKYNRSSDCLTKPAATFSFSFFTHMIDLHQPSTSFPK